MKVSVAMPTHGRAEYLPRAIESVLGQTISDWELIVVDDNPPGSATREETGKVISRYSDSRIRWLMRLLYPFRRLIWRLSEHDKKLHLLGAVLKMDEIARGDEGGSPANVPGR